MRKSLSLKQIHCRASDDIDIVGAEAEQAAFGILRADCTTLRVSADEVFQTEMMRSGGGSDHAGKTERDVIWRGAQLHCAGQLDLGKHLARALDAALALAHPLARFSRFHGAAVWLDVGGDAARVFTSQGLAHLARDTAALGGAEAVEVGSKEGFQLGEIISHGGAPLSRGIGGNLKRRIAIPAHPDRGQAGANHGGIREQDRLWLHLELPTSGAVAGSGHNFAQGQGDLHV